jgi:hypothetical protein
MALVVQIAFRISRGQAKNGTIRARLRLQI